jgi:hypothetical protein
LFQELFGLILLSLFWAYFAQSCIRFYVVEIATFLQQKKSSNRKKKIDLKKEKQNPTPQKVSSIPNLCNF